ncbi:hypothetical protein Tco_1541242 [Tanacetum coccineum]
MWKKLLPKPCWLLIELVLTGAIWQMNEVPTNMVLMAFSDSEEFQQPEFEGYGPKTSKNVSKDTSNEVRESPDAQNGQPSKKKSMLVDSDSSST